MWKRLLDLCAATRRPLVVKDYETAGLNGAPPVEYAVALWTPWAPQEMDRVSVEAREQAPPGLTYAAAGRLNPGCPIDAEAQAVHGISWADVKKAPDYKDLSVSSVFRSLALGDATAEELPCVWVGHNLAEFDLPWAQQWGYIPRDGAAPLFIDTMRIARRLGKEHPFPLAPDAVAWPHCPAVGHGLAPYRDSLVGTHTALFGEPPAQSHGALADVLSSARVLAAMLELWQQMLPGPTTGEDPHKALVDLLGALNRPPPGVLSWDGWIKCNRDTGAMTWARGKHKDKHKDCDRSYAAWCASLPPQPTGINGESWTSDETRVALGFKVSANLALAV
jgi:DNA polymerase III epsilon subunit-like protein